MSHHRDAVIRGCTALSRRGRSTTVPPYRMWGGCHHTWHHDLAGSEATLEPRATPLRCIPPVTAGSVSRATITGSSSRTAFHSTCSALARCF